MHKKFNSFKKINVLDTCSILNITSSKTLCSTALGYGFYFSCTQFVHYECIYKPRKTEITIEQIEHCQEISDLIKQDKIKVCSIRLEALNDITILHARKKLGKGELSSIAFAKSIKHAFLTDDQGARKLANEVLGEDSVQTTPQLFGYLFFHGYLFDSHKDKIIQEHNYYGRPLEKHFTSAYLIALEHKLKERGSD